MPGQPGRGPLGQPGHLTGPGTPQLQLQQAGEQAVVAEPRPGRVHRHHERAGPLQILQDPLPAAGPGQPVGELFREALSRVAGASPEE